MNDTLKNLLLSFGQQAASGVRDSLMSTFQPRQFEAQQQAARQQAQLAQEQSQQEAQQAQQSQQQQNWNLQFQAQQHAQQQNEAHQKFMEQLQLSNVLGGDEYERTPVGKKPDVSLGGTDLSLLPPDKRQGRKGIFTFKPTDDERTQYPWLPAEGVQMPVTSFPGFLKDMTGLEKSNPARLAAYKDSLMGQLDQLIPDTEDKGHMKSLYRFQIEDGIARGDEKAASAPLQELLKNKQEIETERRKQDLQFNPAAVSGHARIAGAEQAARDAQADRHAAQLMPDDVLESHYKNVQSGVETIDSVARDLGFSNPASKARWSQFVARKTAAGYPPPVPLSGKAQSSLMAIEPVKEDLKKFLQNLERVQGDDNTPMTFFKDRLMYSLGSDPEYDSLISRGEMDKIRGAGQSLTGLRASLPLLDKAFIHAPDFWLDSKGQMKAKVRQMVDFLENQSQDIYKYGAKSGVVAPDGSGISEVNKKKLSQPPPPTF